MSPSIATDSLIPQVMFLPPNLSNTLTAHSSLQKNKRDETIGTVPGFAKLLDGVRVEQRTGWIFAPAMQRGKGRLSDPGRWGG